MKNKKATYVLGLAVLSVWGLILYRIFYSGNQQQDRFTTKMQSGPKEQLNDYSIPADTEKLRLNYRDPFGGAAPANTTVPEPVSKVASSPIASLPLPAKPAATDWSFIRYAGFVKNPGNKRLIAMVNIRGKDLMMSEGETAQEVRLLKNLQDSISVQYKGKSKIIKINNKGL
jgi:hypothetical protein